MKKEINRRAFMCHMGAALFLPLGGSADPNGIVNALRPAPETGDLKEPELTTAVLVQNPNLYPPLPGRSFQIFNTPLLAAGSFIDFGSIVKKGKWETANLHLFFLTAHIIMCRLVCKKEVCHGH
ncbi:MAG: hypothetical protein HWN68_16265 [Desulfobacterales bacterium]|nr:hypothetical protein [Desulfobacterales bacterium]